jgi:hypothetical protein
LFAHLVSLRRQMHWCFPITRSSVIVLALMARAPAQAPAAPFPGPPPTEPAQTMTAASSVVSSQPAATSYLHGTVRAGNTAIPGATVTATNTTSRQKYVGWTNLDGSYAIPVPSGHYTLQTEMTAFAPMTREVSVDSTPAQADFTLQLESRVQQAAARPVPTRTWPGGGAGGPAGRGFQSLGLMQSVMGADSANASGGAGDQVVPSGMPVPGIDPNSATESIAVSGNNSGSMLGMSMAEMQQRAQEYRDQQGGGIGGPGGPGGFGGGGFGGPGGGPRGGGGPMMIFGAGGRGRFDINRPHGSVYYSIGASALNASPYSLTGAAVDKPSYLQQRFGFAIGGPLNIPKIYKGGNKTFFFANYTGSRSDTPYDSFSTVPTLLERAGNFSQTTLPNGPDAGAPVAIFDPKTGLQFPNNTLPSIDPAAAGLLKYIPDPNLPGALQNFHFITTAASDLDDFNLRLIHAMGKASVGPGRGGRGPQNNLTLGFHYHGTFTNLTAPYPSVGGSTAVRSFDIPIGYIRSFGKLTNSLRFDYNRNRISTQNLYAFSQDITGSLGINGVSTNPFDWGLPNLSFTNFGGIQDTNPLLRRDQTFTFSDTLIWTHGKHTLRWGGDFRRIQQNTETDSNARGSFIFTGLNTSEVANGAPVTGTGFDFADFLLGLPQQTAVQFGANNYHFRGNSWDLFGQDDWKVRSNLTLNIGLRYEYVSPFTELDNRIVNLDIAPGFTAVAPVLPGQTGPYHGTFPDSLIRPDRNNFAPRIGLAWKVRAKTVFRAGYGVNYATTAYASMVQQLAFQPPFSTTQTNVESATTALTLQNGFPVAPPGAVTNNYSVDPNYRLGYVQIWNADVQQEVTPSLILNLDYTGTKGTRLDVIDAPNRDAAGVVLTGVQPFLWESSLADSTAHSGTVKLRKRLTHGISLGGTYTFSKSIDNASTIGGAANTTVVAQDALNLSAERGLSSFDQRHKFMGDYLWELPLGHDKQWLNAPGALRTLFGDWQWSGDWTVSTGVPFTPRILGNIADVNRGTNGTLRPDLTGQPITISNPSVSQWFNTAAFVEAPLGAYGDARRNSIEGPGAHIFDMSFTKIFPLRESRMLEFRAQFSNIFNTPNFTSIDTTVNTPAYGRVTAVGSMRAIQFLARFRF